MAGNHQFVLQVYQPLKFCLLLTLGSVILPGATGVCGQHETHPKASIKAWLLHKVTRSFHILPRHVAETSRKKKALAYSTGRWTNHIRAVCSFGGPTVCHKAWMRGTVRAVFPACQAWCGSSGARRSHCLDVSANRMLEALNNNCYAHAMRLFRKNVVCQSSIN